MTIKTTITSLLSLGLFFALSLPSAHSQDRSSSWGASGVLPKAVTKVDRPGKRGRYADGRAFRVDNQGFEIADRVAELEVTIDELNQQILTLESRLDGGAVSKLPAATAKASPAFREESIDIIKAQPVARPDKQALELRDRRIRELQKKLSLAEQQIQQKQNQLLETQSQVAETEYAKQSSVDELERIKQSQSALLRSKTEELKSLEHDLSIARKEKSEIANHSSQLQSRLRELEAENASLKEKLARPVALASIEKTKARGSFRQSLKRPATKAASTREVKRDSVTLARTKKSLRQTVGRIHRLIGERKSALSRARASKASKKGTIKVSPRPLLTRRGVSFDKLKVRIAKLTENSNVEKIRRELSELEVLLREDITLAKRIARL